MSPHYKIMAARIILSVIAIVTIVSPFLARWRSVFNRFHHPGRQRTARPTLNSSNRIWRTAVPASLTRFNRGDGLVPDSTLVMISSLAIDQAGARVQRI